MDVEVIKAAVLGHAVADALGVPVEFVSREKLKQHPVNDMLGFGSHDVPKGTWSDDTSMAMCTMASIVAQGKIDLDDIMEAFGKWVEEGYMTPYGIAFDIGRTSLHAIMSYQRGIDVYHCGGDREYDNGNGSLMRMIPVSLYNCLKQTHRDIAMEHIHAVSALTHAHDRSCMACGIYHFVVQELIAKPQKLSVKQGLFKACEYYGNAIEMSSFKRLCSSDFETTAEQEVKSSGYVVDTLEAAIWCVLNTDNYKDCVLKAVNLGEDTDTVAAVAGGLAGVLYGYQQIPTEWIELLAKKDEILELCDRFYETLTGNKQ